MYVSFDILLAYAYEFATTLAFCVFGAFVQELYSKLPKSKKLNVGQLTSSAIFSTILMCAFTKYIDLPLEAYVAVCVICGMWGKKIIMLLMSEKFIHNLLTNLFKDSNPAVKSAIDTASEITEENKQSRKKSTKTNKES